MKVVRLIWAMALASALAAAGFEAGVAGVKITPEGPIRMAGYANRTLPSEGVHDDLWAKALAIRDERGRLTVILTADIVGIRGAMSDRIAARLKQQHGIERARVLLNCSHTHSGPVIHSNLPTMFDLAPEEARRVQDYAERLERQFVEAANLAIAGLKPARLEFATGKAAISVNRRELRDGKIVLGTNREGPVDQEVPVIRVVDATGKLRAILLGLACHNTTPGGDRHISGDYAGLAQAALERAHPGTVAMFLQLCGGDQAPDPKGTFVEAERNGAILAGEVERVLKGKMEPLAGPVESAYEVVQLEFQPHTRSDFEKELSATDAVLVRRAKAMLRAYDDGAPVRSVAYPVQALRFGRRFAIVALGGEVVVDYALRLKKEFPEMRLIVAGYSNDVMAYIPSERMLAEGGYEVVTSMKHYAQPGPFAPGVEERVIQACRSILSMTRSQLSAGMSTQTGF